MELEVGHGAAEFTREFKLAAVRVIKDRGVSYSGIVGPERCTCRSCTRPISHPDRGHDDVANAVAGAAALSNFGGYDTSLRWVSGDDDDNSPMPFDRRMFMVF